MDSSRSGIPAIDELLAEADKGRAAQEAMLVMNRLLDEACSLLFESRGTPSRELWMHWSMTVNQQKGPGDGIT